MFKKPELHHFHRLDLPHKYIQHSEMATFSEVSFLLGQQWAISVPLVLKVAVM